MFNYIKYRLLQWLLDDICERSGIFVSDCDRCDISLRNDKGACCSCGMNGVYKQARKVWKLEE